MGGASSAAAGGGAPRRRPPPGEGGGGTGEGSPAGRRSQLSEGRRGGTGRHGASAAAPSYRCGRPAVSGGEVLPALWRSDCTAAAWRQGEAPLAQDDIVLLYRIVVPRPPYEVWAFYNDTEDIQFHVSIRFYPHPEQRRELLAPLGTTTLVWLDEGREDEVDGGGAVAKLVVGPTETALAVEGHMVAYRIAINGFSTDVAMQ
ncbi:putative calpain-like cysteine peptidase [Trypanosoma conorhini]|uniref:Putative calpain-like cysteine peptidase n=1 Tax=Trypanosoma conorhini TaxID=83891 RepID=A0A3R7KT98_9TRYP|nr:putative calpain-like cysteine peptidase [Trypanosoma conorhini]RNF00912.1 putative calpain-like cysteine peptidase [Trypanosoma conorhini]